MSPTDDTALTIIEVDAIKVCEEIPPRYSDDLAQAAIAAQQALPTRIFDDYHHQISPNTRMRQHYDLENFSTYLAAAGVGRTAEDLANDPHAWRGINYALLRGYMAWAIQQGYSIGTINIRLATIRQYCKLAGPAPEGADVLSEDTLIAILTVKGLSAKKAAHVDEDRRGAGIPTRKGAKKAAPTDLATYQALQLKKTTTQPKKPYSRPHDLLLATRDALMMGLLLEHALRCSEIAALNIEQINLAEGIITFTRRKTKLEQERQSLMPHTRMAAERYLDALNKIGRTQGPLFTGYQGQRIAARTINARVGQLGKQIGVETLSPHDLRHFWSFDALRNGTPLDKVMAGAGWTTPTMALRYAKRQGITNEGVKLTMEE